jgi:hypothetical protein
MIDYTEPKHAFEFHEDEAGLMLFALNSSDTSLLSDEGREDLEILTQAFTEFVLEIQQPRPIDDSNARVS